MRRALRISGNLLIGTSLIGLIALGAALLTPAEAQTTPAGPPRSVVVSAPIASERPVATNVSMGSASSADSVERPEPGTARGPEQEPFRPITRVVVSSIDLSVDVVPSDLVPVEGGITWQVPAFKVGHADGTAGAGQVGNAILLGHVTSLRSGNVFQELERVQNDDVIQVFSGDAAAFDYRVVSTTHVSRSDSDILQPTQIPSVSLITCTGTWLPTIWDYSERWVVHAELSQ
jgi:LPXTG-site transpeptidase (sortase) family protein